MIKPTVAQVFGKLVAGEHRALTADEGMLWVGASEKAAIIEMGNWIAIVDFNEDDLPEVELHESGTGRAWKWTADLGSFKWSALG